MAYRIEILPRAARELARLDRPVQRRLARAIGALADEPRSPASRTLRGADNEFRRLRVGDYRILYEVQDSVLLVLVIHLGHRREVYRKLK